MNFTVDDVVSIIDQVGVEANNKKKLLKKYYIDSVGENFDVPIKWYRTRKNADLKDAFTLEGIKRGFSVRAEKTMGALPEYCSSENQEAYNRFDLSWEKKKDSKDFLLAVEIEMDVNPLEIKRDFKKLAKNRSDCIKVMICQAKTADEIEGLKMEIEKSILQSTSKNSVYLLSIWSWEHGGQFLHFQYKP